MEKSKTRILIVEDEGIVACDLENQLNNLGYEVSAVVGTGALAVEKTREIRPDLVLMDIKLKGEMDGIEAAEYIREHFDCPVVFLTAFSDEETLHRAKISKPFGYILKPFEERELYVNIEIALYQHGLERRLKNYEKHLHEQVEKKTLEVIKANQELAEAKVKQKERERKLKQNFTELRKTLKEAIKALNSVVELLDQLGK
jgi:CheY-like chemotaxis protein